MKELIKRLLRENLLSEAVSDITYHFTHSNKAIKILQTNKINLAAAFGTPSDNDKNKGKLFFLSTTSSRSTDVGYAASIGNTSVVRLTLNGRALNQNYQVTRVDYWQRPKDPRNPTYNPHDEPTGGKSFYKHVSRQDELEDRLISDKNEIKPANKYIMVLEVLNGNPEDLSYIKSLCEGLRIPFYAYDNEAYFNASAKGKAIEVTSSEEKPEAREGYDGDWTTLAAYVVYKDDALRAKMTSDLQKLGVDIDAMNEKIDTRINDKLSYYLRDDNYYLNDFASSMSSSVHNAKASSNEVTRYVIRQLGLDMKRNDTKSLKDYLLYKVYKGKKTQKSFNKELNEKFMSYINNGANQLLSNVSAENIRFSVDGKDYENLMDYKPFKDLLTNYINQLKQYVSNYILNNDDMFKYNYVLGSSYIREHLKINKQDIANVLNNIDFDSDYVSVDDINGGLNYLISDLDNYQYSEIKNAQEESREQFNI